MRCARYSTHCAGLSPKSDMAKAIAYGTKRWHCAAISMAGAWRSITTSSNERCAALLSDRNWLFAGSKTGGERRAAIYTVIQTRKANGVDPQTHITDAIGNIAADWPAARWDELMPWNRAAQTVEPVAQAA